MLTVVAAMLGQAGGKPMPDTLKVVAVQTEVTGDVDRNFARIEKGIAEAATAGARVAVFPETVLSGFNAETVAAIDWPKLEAAMARVARRRPRRAASTSYTVARHARAGGSRTTRRS